MNERQTVWAVTSGEYSDYQVNAICPDKTTAEMVRDRANLLMNVDETSYEAFDIAEMAYVTDPAEVALMRMVIQRPNSAEAEATDWLVLYPFQDEGVNSASHPDDFKRGRGFVWAAARDTQQAKKIAYDDAARRRAEAAG